MKNSNPWIIENNSLVKVFTFHNFVQAVDFINTLVPLAQNMNHHPDLELFSYKKVKIKLTTHDQNKITEKDKELAKKIDELF